MNNLYGWAMSQKMPTGGFEWVEIEDGLLDPDFIDDDEGYIAEVYFDYPQDLHNAHNDFPLAPEHWSDYMCEVGPLNSQGEPCYAKIPKLCPNLRDKEKYIVHHRALGMYLDMGLKLEKIHRVLKFKESAWMAPYININTELRKCAKTDFEKDFLKLMNNSVFRKSMENVRNRIDVKLTVEEKKKEKLINNPRFKCTKEFNEDLSGFLMNKARVELNKPLYIGQAILDVSKTLMYKHFYNYIRAQYLNARMMYTDTDSFLLYIETDDFYKEMSLSTFDTSHFPVDHPCYSAKNKVIGLPNDEGGGKPIAEFVALRAKSYCVKFEDDKIIKCKGVKKCVTN